MTPAVSFLDRDEVNPEPAKNALSGQYMGDPCSVGLNVQPIGRISRKTAAKKDLSIRAAEHLIVRRDCVDAPYRIDAELCGRRLLDASGNKLLDDAAHGAQLFLIEVPRHAPSFKAQILEPIADPRGKRAVCRRMRKIED